MLHSIDVCKNHKNIRLPAAILCIVCMIAGFLFLSRPDAVAVLRLSETEPAYFMTKEDAAETKITPNPCSDLSVPTSVTKIGDTYFIVDCYHNQIIYTDTLGRPLNEWYVMTDEIDRGHTLAGDGVVYLADDTERGRILIFEKKGERFVHTQTFSDIGIRPHYIVYRPQDRCFYAWSSMTGEMYLFRRETDSSRVFLSEIRQIPALNGSYVRSFTIMDDDIYFVSGNASIIKADVDSFRIKEEYPVPDAIAGMVQLTWIDSFFYLTVSTDRQGSQDAATIIRTPDLKNLAAGDYEDVYGSFIGGGTPYYISFIDDRYYLTEHRLPGHSVWSFSSENGELTDIQALY